VQSRQLPPDAYIPATHAAGKGSQRQAKRLFALLCLSLAWRGWEFKPCQENASRVEIAKAARVVHSRNHLYDSPTHLCCLSVQNAGARAIVHGSHKHFVPNVTAHGVGWWQPPPPPRALPAAVNQVCCLPGTALHQASYHCIAAAHCWQHAHAVSLMCGCVPALLAPYLLLHITLISRKSMCSKSCVQSVNFLERAPDSPHNPVVFTTTKLLSHLLHRRPPDVESATHPPSLQPCGHNADERSCLPA